MARQLAEVEGLRVEMVVHSLRQPSATDHHWFTAHLPRATLHCPAYLLSREVAAAVPRALATRPGLLLRLLAALLRDAAGSRRVPLRQRLGDGARRTALDRFEVRRNTGRLRDLLFGARSAVAAPSPRAAGRG